MLEGSILRPFTEVFVVDSCLAGNLLELLAQIPDPRDRRGRRHPLVAMLATIVCAVLTGSRGYRAIAQWARSQSPTVWQWLGFRRKPPCANSFRNLLLALKPEVLESILRQWMAAAVQLPPPSNYRHRTPFKPWRWTARRCATRWRPISATSTCCLCSTRRREAFSVSRRFRRPPTSRKRP